MQPPQTPPPMGNNQSTLAPRRLWPVYGVTNSLNLSHLQVRPEVPTTYSSAASAAFHMTAPAWKRFPPYVAPPPKEPPPIIDPEASPYELDETYFGHVDGDVYPEDNVCTDESNHMSAIEMAKVMARDEQIRAARKINFEARNAKKIADGYYAYQWEAAWDLRMAEHKKKFPLSIEIEMAARAAEEKKIADAQIAQSAINDMDKILNELANPIISSPNDDIFSDSNFGNAFVADGAAVAADLLKPRPSFDMHADSKPTDSKPTDSKPMNMLADTPKSILKNAHPIPLPPHPQHTPLNSHLITENSRLIAQITAQQTVIDDLIVDSKAYKHKIRHLERKVKQLEHLIDDFYDYEQEHSDDDMPFDMLPRWTRDMSRNDIAAIARISGRSIDDLHDIPEARARHILKNLQDTTNCAWLDKFTLVEQDLIRSQTTCNFRDITETEAEDLLHRGKMARDAKPTVFVENALNPGESIQSTDPTLPGEGWRQKYAHIIKQITAIAVGNGVDPMDINDEDAEMYAMLANNQIKKEDEARIAAAAARAMEWPYYSGRFNYGVDEFQYSHTHQSAYYPPAAAAAAPATCAVPKGVVLPAPQPEQVIAPIDFNDFGTEFGDSAEVSGVSGCDGDEFVHVGLEPNNLDWMANYTEEEVNGIQQYTEKNIFDITAQDAKRALAKFRGTQIAEAAAPNWQSGYSAEAVAGMKLMAPDTWHKMNSVEAGELYLKYSEMKYHEPTPPSWMAKYSQVELNGINSVVDKELHLLTREEAMLAYGKWIRSKSEPAPLRHIFPQWVPAPPMITGLHAMSAFNTSIMYVSNGTLSRVFPTVCGPIIIPLFEQYCSQLDKPIDDISFHWHMTGFAEFMNSRW